jgi:hypothetical protein
MTKSEHKDGALVDEATVPKHMVSPWLAQRLLNVPLFLEGRRAAAMLEGLRTKTSLEQMFLGKSQDRQYDVVNGIAVIEIRGILVHGYGLGLGSKSTMDGSLGV